MAMACGGALHVTERAECPWLVSVHTGRHLVYGDDERVHLARQHALHAAHAGIQLHLKAAQQDGQDRGRLRAPPRASRPLPAGLPAPAGVAATRNARCRATSWRPASRLKLRAGTYHPAPSCTHFRGPGQAQVWQCESR